MNLEENLAERHHHYYCYCFAYINLNLSPSITVIAFLLAEVLLGHPDDHCYVY